MGTLHGRDGCEEVRVAVRGNLEGLLVPEIQQHWESAQCTEFWRRFVIDISGLTGYDRAGFELLRKLYNHGAIFAAATPKSLEFLEQVAANRMAIPAVAASSSVAKRAVDRSSSSRPRHRAGLGSLGVNFH